MKTWRGLLVSLSVACAQGAQFRGATAADEAQCRNVWRMVAASCYNGNGLGEALACRSNGADAYDDCMRGKGLVEE